MGDWLPTSVCGYLHALCAYLRMIYVALYLVFLSGVEYDVVFCDQVGCVIVFACHSFDSKPIGTYIQFENSFLCAPLCLCPFCLILFLVHTF